MHAPSRPACLRRRQCVAASATPPAPRQNTPPRPVHPLPTPPTPPTKPRKAPDKSTAGGGGARSAAAARLRRSTGAPPSPVPRLPAEVLGVVDGASTTTEGRPVPPHVAVADEDDDDDFPVEPSILPVDPATVEAARAAAAAGEGLGVTFLGGGGAPATAAAVSAAAPPPPLEPSSVIPPQLRDPDACLRGLTAAEVDAKTDLLMALMLAGSAFEATLRARLGEVDAAVLRLLEKRIHALKLAATTPLDRSGVDTLNLLLARLRAEVARASAAPAERVLDEALKILAPPGPDAMATAAIAALPPRPPPSNGSPPPPSPSSLADARIAAARARLRAAVSGRGGGSGPDPLAAAARAARVGGGRGGMEAGGGGAAAEEADPLRWEGSGEAVPAAALVAESRVLVEAVREQVAELRAAVDRSGPGGAPPRALLDKLAERESLAVVLGLLEALCRELL